jgi:mRNA interferase HigB
MHLITRKTLKVFWQKYPDSKTALERWLGIIEKNNFDSFAQLRETFPSADLVGKLTVFNIGGNKYRLIAAIHFNRQKVYIRNLLTHKEYDRGDWKQ